MTTEELAAAGIPPVEQEILESEIAQCSEANTSPAAGGSENREDGEIRLEGEDIRDIDADPNDLITAKSAKALPPSFVFGESKVTANIREYEAAGFFPAGSGRALLDEQVPLPAGKNSRGQRNCRISRLLHMWAKVPLRSPSACNLGQVFCENSSALTKFVSGAFQVFLDHENFRMQLQCRRFRSIVRVGHRA
jgi:hypothetical protein